MTQQAFQALLAEFFHATGSTDAQTRPGAGHCRCAGLDVGVYYDDTIDPSNVHAYIDLGSVAPARQREVFRTLLSRHPRFNATHSAVVGLDAATDRIVLVARIALDHTLNGRRMAVILMRLIREVYVWRAPRPAVRFGAGKARAMRWPS